MRHRRYLLLFSILAALSAVTVSAEEPADDPLAGEAVEFCEIFLDGEFDFLYDRMTEGMQLALSPQAAGVIRDQLREFGEVVSIGEPWLETERGPYRRYRVPVEFEKGTIDLRVVFDQDGKVATFFHAPHVEPPSGQAAQEAAPEFPGHWEGAIEVPGTPLTVLIDLSYEDGLWSGSADIPMQGAQGLPLTGITVGDGEIEFALADLPGDPTFNGTLADGKITGTFTQGGQSFPFALGREEIPAPARPQEPKPPRS